MACATRPSGLPTAGRELRRLGARPGAPGGGALHFPAGADFLGSHLFWGKCSPRPAPHGGVDLCEVREPNSAGDAGEPRPLPIGFGLPAVADGVVVAVFEDFVGRIVVMRHDHERVPGLGDGETWPLHSLLAHVDLAEGIVPGASVLQASSVLAAALAASNTTAPPHAHLSLLAAPASFPWASLGGWPDLLSFSARREVTFLEPPLRALPQPQQT